MERLKRLVGNEIELGMCYLLSMRWFSLEEERVMQQSSVSIYLSFENQGINPVGDNMGIQVPLLVIDQRGVSVMST